jgi:hypothetical protein
MTKCWTALAACLLISPAAWAEGEYTVEANKAAPPAEVAALAGELAAEGFKVLDGDKVVAEIWPAKKWNVKADFEPTLSILYPLKSGSLVGVLRFPRKGADFRGQDIAKGVYTLRYANQPEDGNHVGTFETRDFLVMLPAKADPGDKPLADADLFKLSAEAAGSTHPAIMPLLKPEGEEAPALRHIEDKEWWALTISGSDAAGGKQLLEVVVAGKAAE